MTHHRTIGLAYTAVSATALIAGTILSLLMRLHLTWPTTNFPLHGPVLPEDYLALVTLHGTLMLFFVLTVAPQLALSNLILPAQIGATRTAFPRLNFLGLTLITLALLTLLASPFVPQGSAISGWTAYPPLSALAAAGPGEALGQDLWLLSIALFCLGSLCAAVNTLVTIITLRCEGLTPARLPLTVWGWFTAALLTVPSFSVLLTAIVLLTLDRHAHTAIFLPHTSVVSSQVITRIGTGSPFLWLHLFWFFGHPEVYIAILPGVGLTSMVLANFARRPIAAYRFVIAATILIGALGILVWGHHMFVAGLSPFEGAAFAISTMAIALPATAEVLSWLATIWGSRPRLTSAMLFALGFVSLFIAGGLTGPMLAQPLLDRYLHNTFFVVAHFHLIMAMAGAFSLFCATYYYFPLLAERTLNETLGRIHFFATIIGAYATFLPMHLAGLAGEPRHYAQLTGVPGPAGALLAGLQPLQRFITFAAIFLALAQLPFLLNLILTLRKPRTAHGNPWQATTLEWAPHSLDPIACHAAPCAYSPDGSSMQPQWLAPQPPE